MKEAISTAGKWTWMEIANDSVQLEFEDVQLYSPKLNILKSHSSIMAIRLANNAFFKFFYNDSKNEEFETVFLDPFYEISYNLDSKNFKFQNFNLLETIENNYKYQKDFFANSKNNIENGEIDFLLCFITDNVAVVTGGNEIQFFNEFNILNEERIKSLSNRWWVYWVDYWKKKNTPYEYEYDPACELVPLNIAIY